MSNQLVGGSVSVARQEFSSDDNLVNLICSIEGWSDCLHYMYMTRKMTCKCTLHLLSHHSCFLDNCKVTKQFIKAMSFSLGALGMNA
jgi:hypothetical protein